MHARVVRHISKRVAGSLFLLCVYVCVWQWQACAYSCATPHRAYNDSADIAVAVLCVAVCASLCACWRSGV